MYRRWSNRNLVSVHINWCKDSWVWRERMISLSWGYSQTDTPLLKKNIDSLHTALSWLYLLEVICCALVKLFGGLATDTPSLSWLQGGLMDGMISSLLFQFSTIPYLLQSVTSIIGQLQPDTKRSIPPSGGFLWFGNSAGGEATDTLDVSWLVGVGDGWGSASMQMIGCDRFRLASMRNSAISLAHSLWHGISLDQTILQCSIRSEGAGGVDWLLIEGRYG